MAPPEDEDDLFSVEDELESTIGSDVSFEPGAVAEEMGAMPAPRPASGLRGTITPRAPHGQRFGGRGPVRQVPATVVIQTQEAAEPSLNAPQPGDRPKFRVRPMPKNLRVKWPDVVTMLITNNDGSQILFTR